MLTMCSNAAAFPLVYHSFSAGIASGYFTLFPTRQAVMQVVSIPFRSRSVAPEPLMSALFRVTTINPFVMAENVPVADRRTDGLYLAEVEKCDLYPGLFGNEYRDQYAMIFQG